MTEDERFITEVEEIIKKVAGCITINLENKDYAVEEHGLNIEINEREIIIYKHPDTKVIYNKNTWDKITFKYEKPLDE